MIKIIVIVFVSEHPVEFIFNRNLSAKSYLLCVIKLNKMAERLDLELSVPVCKKKCITSEIF